MVLLAGIKDGNVISLDYSLSNHLSLESHATSTGSDDGYLSVSLFRNTSERSFHNVSEH